MDTISDRCDCKVGRVIDEFELRGINESLVASRRGDETHPTSLRDLADAFNQAVVRSAVQRGDSTPLDGEVENTYRLLTADDVSSGMRIRARKRLEGEGVDLDAVERGFVSHPTMGSHLKDCLGVERASDPGDPVQTARERIFKLQSRGEAVIRNTLDGLGSGGQLAAGGLAVTVDARVMCEACGVHAEVGAFIERGGCDCSGRDDV